MTESITYRKPGHLFTAWKYDHGKRRWFRHCSRVCCTAVESVPRGHRPKGQ